MRGATRRALAGYQLPCRTSWHPPLPRAWREEGQQDHAVLQRTDQRLRGAQGLVPGHTLCVLSWDSGCELWLLLAGEVNTGRQGCEAPHVRGWRTVPYCSSMPSAWLRARPSVSLLRSRSELSQQEASAALVVVSLL